MWYAFLTGFALMVIGVTASFFMADARPADSARKHDAG
jgi:hypothetical protein